MNSNSNPKSRCRKAHRVNDTDARLIEKALELGADLAGIAPADALLKSPSYVACPPFEHPAGVLSVLVLGLHHGVDELHLDVWDGEGGTPGNRRITDTAEQLAVWAKEELGLDARTLAYHPSQGGVFLKDAAVLAGLGAVGLNNLLVTPRFGPHVRFRALGLDVRLASSNPLEFHPCDRCPRPCTDECPQEAFSSGSFSRDACMRQMRADEAHVDSPPEDGTAQKIVYCRACELACRACCATPS